MTQVGYNGYQQYPYGQMPQMMAPNMAPQMAPMQPQMAPPQMAPQGMPMQQGVPQAPMGQMPYNPGIAPYMIPNFNQPQAASMQAPQMYPAQMPQMMAPNMAPQMNPNMQPYGPQGMYNPQQGYGPMNAQMPAPNMQNDQYKPLPNLNLGVVDGPQYFSQTPITDELARRSQYVSQPDPTAPQVMGGKKSKMSLGRLSALLMGGSGLIILGTLVSKIIKTVRH